MNVGINHYLETIYNPFGRFRTLNGIRFGVDSRGEPDFQAGSNAVLFRASLSGRTVAMKCYTKPDGQRENRQKIIADYLNRLNFSCLNRFECLDNEIYVYDDFGKGAYYPVTLAEWVDGVSLKSWLAEKCQQKDHVAIAGMAGRFNELALWLLAQEWAHGDLKPDNIIVTPGGDLRLIDYDCAFVPELAGRFSPELGTPGFQHPERDALFYNRHMDDYSMALIAAALYALAAFPEWYTEQDDERLLFDPAGVAAGSCPSLHRTKEHWIDTGRTDLYRLAALLESPHPEIPALAQTLRAVSEKPAVRTALDENAPEIYRENGFYGYRTSAGERLTEAIYDDAEPFREGLAAVRIGRKRCYIDRNGQKRVDASAYNRIASFSGGRAAVRRGEKWGYIAPAGILIVPATFGNARSFREGVAAVEKAGKWGYIDPAGAWAIEPTFDSASDFREGIAVAGLNGRFGYINRRGDWLIAPCFTFASGLRGGAATAEKEGQPLQLVRRGEGGLEVCGCLH